MLEKCVKVRTYIQLADNQIFKYLPESKKT